MKFTNNTIDIRIIAVGAGILLVVILIVTLIARRAVNPAETSLVIVPSVEVAIQKLLTRYQIDEKSIRTRRVNGRDGVFSRIERRVSVAPDFNSMSFNHDLNKAVEELGANAIATEKSEDKTVTVHVKKDGIIIESIVLVVKND